MTIFQKIEYRFWRMRSYYRHYRIFNNFVPPDSGWYLDPSYGYRYIYPYGELATPGVTPNVCECDICGSAADLHHEHAVKFFQCKKNSFHVGDTWVGIFTDLSKECFEECFEEVL